MEMGIGWLVGLLFTGADITDYFNYGFNEHTWRAYCAKQKQMREEQHLRKRINVRQFLLALVKGSTSELCFFFSFLLLLFRGHMSVCCDCLFFKKGL